MSGVVKFLVILMLLVQFTGCAYSLSRSRPAYPPNCPFADERECNQWFFGN